MNQFLFIQLTETDSTKPVEILRTGTFTDKNGKEVTITSDDLDAFIANFQAGAAGQDVPIDIDHKREEAGGWLKRLSREGEKLVGVIDWNELGRQLVGDKVYKYLSATIDLAGKVIKSVSLVNFPAVKGLKAIELGEGACGFQQVGLYDTVKEMLVTLMKKQPAELMEGMNEIGILQSLQSLLRASFNRTADSLALTGQITNDERVQFNTAIEAALAGLDLGEAGNRLIPAPEFYPMFKEKEVIKPMDEKEKEALRQQLREEERAKVEAELADRAKTEAELREKVRGELEAELRAKYEKRQGLVEFAAKVTGGEFGLSEKPEVIVEFLEALPEAQQEAAKRMLQAKVVKLVELGSAGDGKEKKPQLPVHARADVISGELTVAELFKAHVLDGKPEDYDLSEFDTKQKGF